LDLSSFALLEVLVSLGFAPDTDQKPHDFHRFFHSCGKLVQLPRLVAESWRIYHTPRRQTIMPGLKDGLVR